MSTIFWLNELNPKQRVSTVGDKVCNASRYPKMWENDKLVDNPFYAGMYLPFFDITHTSEQRKWGMSYLWVISLNGEIILTRDAGHCSNIGVKTVNRYYDVNDGPLPSFESSVQYEFKSSLLEGGFNLESINKLRKALNLPELEDFIEY